jgi:hypothetical protein
MTKQELVEIGRGTSVEQQLREMRPSQLWEELAALNEQMVHLGVKVPISRITYGASTHGFDYEDRRYEGGGAKHTPMNCLMTALHEQPRLRRLPTEKFEDLGSVISRVAMTTEVLFKKIGSFTWPDAYTRYPRVEEENSG